MLAISSNLHFLKTNLITFLLLLPLLAHPFSFNITDFAPTANDIYYEGDSKASNDGGIELLTTYNWKYLVGHASYVKTLQLWDSSTGKVADFTTYFSFIIETKTDAEFCDGFAFFIAPVNYAIPPNSAGGYLGLFNSSLTQQQIVVVEFDTYTNSEWDPAVNHVGINNGTIFSAVCAPWNISSISGKQAHAWISYNATTKNLGVFWTYEKDPVFRGNFTLSYNIDLMEVLPEQVRIGFSASSGVYFQRNTIHSWQFNSSMDSVKVIQPGKAQRGLKKLVVMVGVGGFSTLMFGVGIGYFFIWRRRIKKSSRKGKGNREIIDGFVKDDLEKGSLPRRFCFQELEMATNIFADDLRLGRGGSGHVYKGILYDLGRLVAVKRIFTESANSEKIFINEVKIISRLIHRNLVPFIGWCQEQGKFLLVYDYMPNGSLDTHLFGNRRTLPWQVHYKIAIGLASALHYLHEEAERCVLHRDIKSANVLLDTDFSAKLGDFGVAKLVDSRLRTQTTGIVGTYGYLAPEYVNEGRASKESDMYSFGIVALELACGRRTYQDGEYHLPLTKWVWQLYLMGNILDAVDEQLNSVFDREEMECLLKVGLWCAHPNDKERPKAGQVTKILQLEAHLPELPIDAYEPAFSVATSQPLQVNSAAEVMSSSIHLGR